MASSRSVRAPRCSARGDTELLDAYNEELANITGDEQSYLDLVEPFGFSAENLPPADLTTEQLCSGDLEDFQ